MVTITENQPPVLRYILSPPDIPFLVTGGSLQSTQFLDAEVRNNYTFEVVAVSVGNLTSDPLRVTVLVEDENEHIPEFDTESYEFTYPEDTATHEELFRVEATDLDVGDIYGHVSYSIPVRPESVPIPFAVSHSNGSVLSQYFPGL